LRLYDVLHKVLGVSGVGPHSNLFLAYFSVCSNEIMSNFLVFCCVFILILLLSPFFLHIVFPPLLPIYLPSLPIPFLSIPFRPLEAFVTLPSLALEEAFLSVYTAFDGTQFVSFFLVNLYTILVANKVNNVFTRCAAAAGRCPTRFHQEQSARTLDFVQMHQHSWCGWPTCSATERQSVMCKTRMRRITKTSHNNQSKTRRNLPVFWHSSGDSFSDFLYCIFVAY